MNESQLLNETLNLINDDGTLEAYEFLVSNLELLDDSTSQVYNFLYCLAATSGRPSESLDWMEEAIEMKGFWYRPEVFEDEDLDSIRDNDRFVKYSKLSNAKFMEAKETVEPVFTWEHKVSEDIITVLHGNQQNNKISEGYWSVLELPSYQIEYLQSEEIDSYQLFRWEDEGNGPTQLENVINLISWDEYNTKVLGGFSAGCNTILRFLSETTIECDKVILQSPWIPCIEEDIEGIISNLIMKDIEVLIICGNEDEDCLSQCLKFESKAKELGLKIDVNYIQGLGHDYPGNFKDIVLQFLKF
jgi:hypothetical protein